MVECPNCSKQTEFTRLCSHCGGIVIHTVEEKFNLLAESVETVLKKEALKRKQKKRTMSLVWVMIILGTVVALIIGLDYYGNILY
jgi:undecaprenyl pyrophosphate phosphatase UppP